MRARAQRLIERDQAEAGRDLLVQAGERGDALSLSALASLFHDGARGVPRDVARSAAYAKAAADKGSAHGMYQYGQSLFAGDGTRRDRSQAVIYMRRAADAGDADARAWLERSGAR